MVSIKLSENNGRAPEAVPYMPAGLNHICCTVNGRAAKRTVMVDAATCERLNADLQEKLQASKGGEKARPVVLFDHRPGAAAAVPQGFEWDEKRGIDSMSESEWLGMQLCGFLADKIFRKPKKKKEEKLQASRRRKQPVTLPDGTRCFTEDCERHVGSLAVVQEAKKAVQKYKATRMRDAQAHAKAVLPREVATPLPDVPLASLNGSDIKEMLNPKALFASACNGVSPDVHVEAVLRTPELLRNANEVSRRAGGKKSRVVIKNGKEVWREDPIAEIVELDAPFHAAGGGAYTACYKVQKYKQQNMKPKIYFMYCRKS